MTHPALQVATADAQTGAPVGILRARAVLSIAVPPSPGYIYLPLSSLQVDTSSNGLAYSLILTPYGPITLYGVGACEGPMNSSLAFSFASYVSNCSGSAWMPQTSYPALALFGIKTTCALTRSWSATPSATPTPTPSSTRSQSRTVTRSSTPSQARSPSQSQTGSVTRSTSATASRTCTESRSGSRTRSQTASQSASSSPPQSASASTSASPSTSASMSGSASQVATASSSASQSLSQTQTPSTTGFPTLPVVDGFGGSVVPEPPSGVSTIDARAVSLYWPEGDPACGPGTYRLTTLSLLLGLNTTQPSTMVLQLYSTAPGSGAPAVPQRTRVTAFAVQLSVAPVWVNFTLPVAPASQTWTVDAAAAPSAAVSFYTDTLVNWYATQTGLAGNAPASGFANPVGAFYSSDSLTSWSAAAYGGFSLFAYKLGCALTATQTQSGSETRSPSRSRSPTPSQSRSTSLTRSSSRTASRSASQSYSPTQAPSRATPSQTQSPSAGATPSSSPSNSQPMSVSETGTATGSSSPSLPSTPSSTPSPTPSPTSTASVSVSRSQGQTCSSTASQSASASGSRTPSRSGSLTQTRSSTASPSQSATPSTVPTPSPSGSPTSTTTLSQSTTPSNTPTSSLTRSCTASPSLSASSTVTSTLSPSSSATTSTSPTLTASAASSPSESQSPSEPAPSRSATGSPSTLATRSMTPSPSASPTQTATALSLSASSVAQPPCAGVNASAACAGASAGSGSAESSASPSAGVLYGISAACGLLLCVACFAVIFLVRLRRESKRETQVRRHLTASGVEGGASGGISNGKGRDESGVIPLPQASAFSPMLAASENVGSSSRDEAAPPVKSAATAAAPYSRAPLSRWAARLPMTWVPGDLLGGPDPWPLIRPGQPALTQPPRGVDPTSRMRVAPLPRYHPPSGLLVSRLQGGTRDDGGAGSGLSGTRSPTSSVAPHAQAPVTDVNLRWQAAVASDAFGPAPVEGTPAREVAPAWTSLGYAAPLGSEAAEPHTNGEGGRGSASSVLGDAVVAGGGAESRFGSPESARRRGFGSTVYEVSPPPLGPLALPVALPGGAGPASDPGDTASTLPPNWHSQAATRSTVGTRMAEASGGSPTLQQRSPETRALAAVPHPPGGSPLAAARSLPGLPHWTPPPRRRQQQPQPVPHQAAGSPSGSSGNSGNGVARPPAERAAGEQISATHPTPALPRFMRATAAAARRLRPLGALPEASREGGKGSMLQPPSAPPRHVVLVPSKQQRLRRLRQAREATLEGTLHGSTQGGGGGEGQSWGGPEFADGREVRSDASPVAAESSPVYLQPSSSPAWAPGLSAAGGPGGDGRRALRHAVSAQVLHPSGPPAGHWQGPQGTPHHWQADGPSLHHALSLPVLPARPDQSAPFAVNVR